MGLAYFYYWGRDFSLSFPEDLMIDSSTDFADDGVGIITEDFWDFTSAGFYELILDDAAEYGELSWISGGVNYFFWAAGCIATSISAFLTSSSGALTPFLGFHELTDGLLVRVVGKPADGLAGSGLNTAEAIIPSPPLIGWARGSKGAYLKGNSTFFGWAGTTSSSSSSSSYSSP